jgi:hypothetical protein
MKLNTILEEISTVAFGFFCAFGKSIQYSRKRFYEWLGKKAGTPCFTGGSAGVASMRSTASSLLRIHWRLVVPEFLSHIFVLVEK